MNAYSGKNDSLNRVLMPVVVLGSACAGAPWVAEFSLMTAVCHSRSNSHYG